MSGLFFSVTWARLSGKAKEGNDKQEEELRSRRDELMKNEPNLPVRRRFRINDPTIEALQDILKDDPKCLLLERDERVPHTTSALFFLMDPWECVVLNV